MSAHQRITQKQKVDIIKAYCEQLTPMITLAKTYGVTRQAIYKILKRAGVNTTKRRLPVSCTVCSAQITRSKSQIRHQKNHFCSEVCYHAFLQAGNFTEWRYGSRVARAKVSDHFQLKEGHIVHHEDGNQYNNRLDNLRVFANQGDHIRHHRGFDVSPIWDGSSISSIFE